MSINRLIYLPLGGAGEVGMNTYIYGFGRKGKERLIVVDLGVTFSDAETSPGVDLILPDLTWLEENKNRLEGIIISHPHMDHIGALGHVWERLRVPIYARMFTGQIANKLLSEKGFSECEVKIMNSWPSTFDLGPFQIGFVPVSHSIPESSALVLDTEVGRLVHSGDFKLDETPVVGEPFDLEMWKKIAETGIQAFVCDSTNIFANFAGRSESSLSNNIDDLFVKAEKMIVATTFSSNLARLKTLAEAGGRAGRYVCLLGRAMQQMFEIGKKTDIIKAFPKLIELKDIQFVPRNKLLLIVTGSQGERRAASAQLASGKYRGIELEAGDLFLFSSKTIPGNERSVIRIINKLSEKGVNVVSDETPDYHVSGHANYPELDFMHQLLNPKMIIPMHGEHRHLKEHCNLAQRGGRASIVCVNGEVIDLSGDYPTIADKICTGRKYIDGKIQISADDGTIRNRIRMALHGHLIISVLIDEGNNSLEAPSIRLRGLPEVGVSKISLIEVLEEDLGQFMAGLNINQSGSDEELEEILARAARKICLEEIGKKPEITVILNRFYKS